MGFYSPDQLLQDTRRRALQIRPVGARHGGWDCSLEPSGQAQPAIRLGLRMIRDFRKEDARRIEQVREAQLFPDVHDLGRRARLDARALELLADTGTLRGLAGHRHKARWAVANVEPQLPLFAEGAVIEESAVSLPLPSRGEELLSDYALLGTILGPHPLKLLHGRLKTHRCRGFRELAKLGRGRPIRVAGLVVGRQRPQTVSGITSITLEGGFGMVSMAVRRNLAEWRRRPFLESQLLQMEGILESSGEVRHVIAGRLHNLGPLLTGLDARSRDFH